MIQYVIDTEVYSPPYIAWISRGQLLWGEGKHWKDAPPYLKKGILKHAGIRTPGQGELDRQRRAYGYCMESPEPRCWDLTGLMKSQFINKKANGKGFSSIEFLYGKGYIDRKTNKLDPFYSYGITGWFLFHADPEIRKTQLEWLENQPRYIVLQYERNCSTFKNMIKQQVNSGQAKAITNSYLLDQVVYKEIHHALIQRGLLPAPTEEALEE